ncbi:MAG: bifunctional (p)ppGpp synthetase/guanosine-3',5'-bis(diphosphate) 3'-pyrophosphohydrolase [Pseudomonadales bacterium]|jgi:RelA/SpoT family (p)ppGpp synthetase|nr:bifunctional (p)ppGpp synthetase/guanosine-3',5'-bis(diphosphate) 3'-pyrophosphohydrolase [Pseudomonadales bacterium]MDP6469428.1 bifunctional (p)ppGpp synthetase/guanosine-3',5'-bis(diphosphate) 3'-pyrophosphohydrolase [Pseudomonadales bacterium]MDP6827270.1 bifunctional (p)ppGpp synthetase/guanosine-3',5'-bis(diphosphate) 3'-pyrophosphohydrolase [Pseudomonadales bacterium]MDP6971093.1 bifunctional (p)ppGpp synthetase/guanosine-3',5'-bis(diphosphate) 3'-pyrophosphohydrolase [Pseudomonadales 
MTKPPAAPPSESYFVSRLADDARRKANAYPTTVDSLVEVLNEYLTEKEVGLVVRAYNYAESAHTGQFRRTGHPYITHPLAVAGILADMRMDHQTLMAALLHDVIEDTQVAKSTLGNRFGKSVAEIVDGVSKLTTIFKSRAEAQAENFQKMAMAMAKDIRVIMVKIADRLHNMRTIGVMDREQRKLTARETLEYYAPIANRLGMHNVKVEFEDLGFAALYPLRADRIRRAVDKARGNRKELMDELGQSIRAALKREGISATVTGREKHLYSIYQKMKSQHKPFREIMDVFGFRIVVDGEDACYRTLGVVHNLYKPVAGRFKDYVAIPKVNGYQSLHTTLFGMHGVPIEVQIRTQQMDEVAEYGIAGHRFYKAPAENTHSGQRTRQWVRDLMELQQRAGDPLEFIESLKVDLFPDDVYVFTPKGDIMELPRGACPVDFAYSVHTDIGNQCVACRIDRALAPLSQQLQSGQRVEIITSPDANPNPDWLTFAVTSKARSAIRTGLKNQQRAESIILGRKLLNRSLANAGTSINDLDFRRLRRVFKEFGVRKLDDVLATIGMGELMSYVVAQHLLVADNPDYEAVPVEQGGPVAIRGGEGLVITYGRCCGPVPGDAIVGSMTPGKGFVVHIETCKNINEMRRRAPNQIIPARWTSVKDAEYLTALRIEVSRKKGIIAELAATVAGVGAGLDRINVDERDAAVSSVIVEVGVHDRDHLARVMRRLRAIPSVLTIARTSA